MATDFPTKGDDRPVSLRNSAFPRFDLDYAAALRSGYPALWAKGAHTAGDAQHDILARVHRQGGIPHTPAEDAAVRLREAWGAEHADATDVASTCAQIHWLVVGAAGESGMKKTMTQEKTRDVQPPVNAALASSDARGDRSGAAGVNDPPPARTPGAQDVLFVQASLVPDLPSGDRATEGAVDATNRFRFVASTEVIDSHESILRQNWDLTRYRTNPVFQWAHNRNEDRPAIGTVEGAAVDKKAKALTGVVVLDNTTEFDREILAKVQKKIIRGISVGFRANKYTIEEIDGEEILVLDELELMEISLCNVPSNPDGLIGDPGSRNRSALARMADRARAAQFAERAGAVPFAALPTSTGPWSATAAEKRVRAWATKADGTLDLERFASAFGYVDPAKRSDPGGYRFLHSDVVDGKLVAVRAGVLEAVRAVKASGLPEQDLVPVRRHLAAELALFRLTPPWARQAPTPTPTTPLAAAPRGSGDRTMALKTTDKTTNIRAAGDKGMTCSVDCPHCEEPFDMSVKVAPMSIEKAAELEKASLDLVTRTAELTATTSQLTELRALKTADEQRLTALDGDITETRKQLIEAREATAARDIDALIAADKVTPAERAAELDIAKLHLADMKRGVDGKIAGVEKWDARLAILSGREARGLLGGSVIPKDQNKPGGVTPGAAPGAPIVNATGKDGEGRTVGGASLAALIVSAAETTTAV